MRFSEAFNITRKKADDWFDPYFEIDTALFVDPFLMLRAGETWGRAHAELLDHFEQCYRLIAEAAGPQTNNGKAARRLLTFPEPSEFCLGFTKAGTRGAGSGRGYADTIADGIAVAIAAGLVNVEHIEEIGILNEGFGADRISDAVCNVLKGRFITYTQHVARRHKLLLEKHRVKNLEVDLAHGRWVNGEVLLPTNPINGQPVILAPEKLLNDLPVLNADDWFDSNINADVRDDLNLKVGDRVRKSTIVDIARRNPERVRTWARQQTSREDLRGYDFAKDPLGVVQFDREPVAFAEAHPLAMVLTPPSNAAQLAALIQQIIEQFRHFIEQQRGWELLWNDNGSEKPEQAAQLAFLAMAKHYLRLYDVELDREVELGRGPVDFKAARGTSVRALIEIKKAHNGRFWNGLDEQLSSYLKSDDGQHGWFVAIRYRNNKASELRMRALPERVAACAARSGKTLRYGAVDARRPKSASKI
jgi:hypothetical protein